MPPTLTSAHKLGICCDVHGYAAAAAAAATANIPFTTTIRIKKAR